MAYCRCNSTNIYIFKIFCSSIFMKLPEKNDVQHRRRNKTKCKNTAIILLYFTKVNKDRRWTRFTTRIIGYCAVVTLFKGLPLDLILLLISCKPYIYLFDLVGCWLLVFPVEGFWIGHYCQLLSSSRSRYSHRSDKFPYRGTRWMDWRGNLSNKNLETKEADQHLLTQSLYARKKKREGGRDNLNK